MRVFRLPSPADNDVASLNIPLEERKLEGITLAGEGIQTFHTARPRSCPRSGGISITPSRVSMARKARVDDATAAQRDGTKMRTRRATNQRGIAQYASAEP